MQKYYLLFCKVYLLSKFVPMGIVERPVPMGIVEPPIRITQKLQLYKKSVI